MFQGILSSLLQCKKPRLNVKTREDLVAKEISVDLMIEILTRLPAKSLMRFKCVSRSWSCLIRSRYFTNRYRIARSLRLYISLVDHDVCDSMEVCADPGKSMLVVFSLSSSKATKGSSFWRRLRFERYWMKPKSVESFHKDLTMRGVGGHNIVALRGLILYTVCRKACIYNPTTRQSLTLPAAKSNIFAQEGPYRYVDYFLGHDPILDQYKVVCNVTVGSENFEKITSEHWVLVVEVGGSWKRIDFKQPHCPIKLGICIDGVIYYLAATSMSIRTVVSFDVRLEEFNMSQVVPDDVSKFAKCVGFIKYGGRPTIFVHTNLVRNGMVDLWVLEDGGKWSKKSLVLQPCQMHLVNNGIHLIVQGTTQNGEVILEPILLISPYKYILYYDLQKNDLMKVTIRGISNKKILDSYTYLKLMDPSENIRHLET